MSHRSSTRTACSVTVRVRWRRCHSSLYADARPWAKAIKQKVVAREMPPWFADPQYRKLKQRSQADPEGDRHDRGMGGRRRTPGRSQGSDRRDAEVRREAGCMVSPTPSSRCPSSSICQPKVRLRTRRPMPRSASARTSSSRRPRCGRHITGWSTTRTWASSWMPPDTKLVDGKPFAPDGKPLPRNQIKSFEADTQIADDAAKIVCYVPGRGWERWPDGIGKRISSRLVRALQHALSGDREAGEGSDRARSLVCQGHCDPRALQCRHRRHLHRRGQGAARARPKNRSTRAVRVIPKIPAVCRQLEARLGAAPSRKRSRSMGSHLTCTCAART